MNIATSPAYLTQYEFEVPFQSSTERVWQALLTEIHQWWLPDFHMVAPDSTVTLDPQPGGRGLLEEHPSGGGLQWYTVQLYQPEQWTLHLVGYLGPGWGGPATSHMKWWLESTDAGCVLKIVDAHQGATDEAGASHLRDGWRQLFEDGLRQHVEGSP